MNILLFFFYRCIFPNQLFMTFPVCNVLFSHGYMDGFKKYGFIIFTSPVTYISLNQCSKSHWLPLCIVWRRWLCLSSQKMQKSQTSEKSWKIVTSKSERTYMTSGPLPGHSLGRSIWTAWASFGIHHTWKHIVWGSGSCSWKPESRPEDLQHVQYSWDVCYCFLLPL